jgi:periplasmic divalent cation tolerance protein
MSTQALLVLTTCGNDAQARTLADVLVGERLAACVNAMPGVSSTYRWKGRIEHDAEVLLLIKTTEDRFEAVEHAIKAQAGYELPEIVAVPIQTGSAEYLACIGATLKD